MNAHYTCLATGDMCETLHTEQWQGNKIKQKEILQEAGLWKEPSAV